ncbi:ABC transporter permease [Nocardioides gilvus]|uniref:ABC transporter permease n=1 Tax=Nocardioides gilvus TaxID=1735589 RepID=UPI000D750AF5|nr:ABC transporter permease [Nocardioides gilvus]
MLRAALKSLLGRKVRLLMSTFAIVLGVAFVAGTLVFSDTLNRSFTALFASTVGDVVVQAERGTRTLPADLVDKLAQVDGAARADGNVLDTSVFVIDKNNKPIGGNGAPALASNWTGAPAGHGLVGLEVVSGRAPEKAGEVVFDATTARRAGYAIGERVTLVTGAQEALDPELVGIVDFAEGGSFSGATWVAFDTRTAQQQFLKGRDRFNSAWVTAAPGVSQEELRDLVAEELPKGFEARTGDDVADESASALLKAVSFLTTFLLIFAGISLVVGAFLIVNTFSILVAQRSRELALFRALGASRRQVTSSVLLEAFVLGVLGSTVGIALGVVMAMGIRALFSNFGLDLSGQSLVFQPRTFIASYLVGVLVTMAAAWFPARRTARIAPIQAMRDDVAMPESSLRNRFIGGSVTIVVGGGMLALGLGGSVPRAGWFVGLGILAILLGVAAASPVISQPFLLAARALFAATLGTVGNLAGQNSLRNPRRTTATASALMIGLALASTMAIVGDSAKASVDATLEESFRGDYVVSSVVGQPFSTAIARQMAKVDGVEEIAALRFAFASAADGAEDEWQQGISAASRTSLEGLVGLEMREGSLSDLGKGRVVVGESHAADEGLAVGDTLSLVVNETPVEWKVVGIFVDNPIVVFPVVTSPKSFLAAGLKDRDSQLMVDVVETSFVRQSQLSDVIADQPLISLMDQADFAAEQREPIDQMVTMIFALLGLALLIAVLGIVNTLALSVIERTREIGLLRAIGLSRGQLRVMITIESMVIALLGALLGIGLGVGFGVALMHSLREQGLEVISVPWDQLIVFGVVALLVGVLAAVLPARKAARLDVLAAIATA